jgi:hypothetical protein
LVTGHLKINSTEKIISPALFTIDGKQTGVTFSGEGYSVSANLSNLSSGFYLLTFADEKGNLFSKKIFKNY